MQGPVPLAVTDPTTRSLLLPSLPLPFLSSPLVLPASCSIEMGALRTFPLAHREHPPASPRREALRGDLGLRARLCGASRRGAAWLPRSVHAPSISPAKPPATAELPRRITGGLTTPPPRPRHSVPTSSKYSSSKGVQRAFPRPPRDLTVLETPLRRDPGDLSGAPLLSGACGDPRPCPFAVLVRSLLCIPGGSACWGAGGVA